MEGFKNHRCGIEFCNERITAVIEDESEALSNEDSCKITGTLERR